MLKDDEKRAQIFKEYGKLMDDYNTGMKIIRFNYAAQYSIPYIAEIIEGMKREPIRFKAESGYLPDREMFISQDEIDKIITNGKTATLTGLKPTPILLITLIKQTELNM